MSVNQVVYFASDFHLGVDARDSSLVRERKIVSWLDQIAVDADQVYLVGDLFDFWFEYRHVVPRGHFRLLAKLDELVQRGVQLEIFTGNHDMWMFDYLEVELNVVIHRSPIRRVINNSHFFIGHGDGLGPGDHGYKMMKKFFANPLCQFLYARLHPNFGLGMAKFWSGKSRNYKMGKEEFVDAKDEWLVQYSEKILTNEKIDFFVFGHRHFPLDITLRDGISRYINLGDWIDHYTYARYDGHNMKIMHYES